MCAGIRGSRERSKADDKESPGFCCAIRRFTAADVLADLLTAKINQVASPSNGTI
jgi:hypothetical protein